MNELQVMLENLNISPLYVLGINVFTFFVFGYDKWCAINDKRRVRNAHLLGLALIGGSVGAILGMQIFRHKTKSDAYVWGVPLMLIMQIGLLINLSEILQGGK